MMPGPNFWAVGAAHDGEDVSDTFLKEGIWYDGYGEEGDDRNASQLGMIRPGDVLVMESSATKGKNHQITFTRIKGIGIIQEGLASHRFRVEWLLLSGLPHDVEGVSYRKTIEPVREDALHAFVQTQLQTLDMTDLLQLLRNKKQIILQGPPGTGKTFLSKKLAAAITEPKRLGQRSSVFDDFEAHWKGRPEELAAQQQEDQALLKEFQEKFPAESLKDLSLEGYAIGTGSKDTFCWWIERGLKELGSYSPGSSRSYLVYWSREKQEYSLHGSTTKSLGDPEAAMALTASKIHELVTYKGEGESGLWFGDSYNLKILHSYHPKDFFPINGKNHLKGALNLLGIDPKAYSTPRDKNLALNERFMKEKKERGFDMGSMDFMRYLSDNYDLKGNLEISQEGEVIAKGAYQVLQFHPAYSYEDFVRGIAAEVEEGVASYRVQNRILVEMAQRAVDSPNANFVLIIDEINRANLPAVLGELIYALEYRGEEVESLYEHPEDGRAISLPLNLYIIGTMNTADRSVGHLDYAIRRRFAFVEMLPERDVIQTEAGKRLFDQVEEIFRGHLSADFRLEDVQIGHSYFMTTREEELSPRLQYEILPILTEYLKDGVLKSSSKEPIKQLLTHGKT